MPDIKPYAGDMPRGERLWDPNDPKEPKWVREVCEYIKPLPLKRNASQAALLRRMKQLEELIAPLAEELKECRKLFTEGCKHPKPHRRYWHTYSEDEYGSTLKSPDFVWCTDCGKKIGQTEPR